MTNSNYKSPVIVFGTLHLEPEQFPEYAKRLEAIIEEIAPDIICAELSPEQLAGTQSCNSKPEQRDVVIPTAKRLDIRIIPIQSPTDEATEWEKRFKANDKELRKDNKNSIILDYLDRLSFKEAESWQVLMKRGDCIENLQLEEHDLFPQARDELEREIMPGRAKLLEEWNESFLKRIEKTVGENPGMKILVIAGLWHKYWLFNRLKENNKVIVYNLHSYRSDF